MGRARLLRLMVGAGALLMAPSGQAGTLASATEFGTPLNPPFARGEEYARGRGLRYGYDSTEPDGRPAQGDRATDKPTVDFVRDVRPILSKYCLACHGPEKQKSGLRLDRKKEEILCGDSGQ